MRLCILIVTLAVLSTGLMAQDDTTTFFITVENVSGIGKFENTGTFELVVESGTQGPINPGEAYEIVFPAFMAERFSFVTMVAESNDLFIATQPEGVELYDENGEAPEGDITDQVALWDLGTEVNEPIKRGVFQAPRQFAPGAGEVENGVVRPVTELEDDLTYPDVSELVSVTITPQENTGTMDGIFTVRIENVSGETTAATALTPGVWVLHNLPGPFFTPGEPDYGEGLEALAEDGDNFPLATVFIGSNLTAPITPVLWAISDDQNPLFTPDEPDHGEGLEALAEDGDANTLAETLATNGIVSGVTDTALNKEESGPALPEEAYQFEITASSGDYLYLATMFVESNDLFFAPGDGIPLFSDDEPVNGSVIRHIQLWDAGTEVNEFPGFGPNQPPRQSAPNTGEDEDGVVQPISAVDDGFQYPPVAAVIRVTIAPKE